MNDYDDEIEDRDDEPAEEHAGQAKRRSERLHRLGEGLQEVYVAALANATEWVDAADLIGAAEPQFSNNHAVRYYREVRYQQGRDPSPENRGVSAQAEIGRLWHVMHRMNALAKRGLVEIDPATKRQGLRQSYRLTAAGLEWANGQSANPAPAREEQGEQEKSKRASLCKGLRLKVLEHLQADQRWHSFGQLFVAMEPKVLPQEASAYYRRKRKIEDGRDPSLPDLDQQIHRGLVAMLRDCLNYHLRRGVVQCEKHERLFGTRYQFVGVDANPAPIAEEHVEQVPTLKFFDFTLTLPFEDLLRPLTADERAALKRSIKKHGIKSPVVVDENYCVIDGANRARIAKEVGLPTFPVYQMKNRSLTPEEKRTLAIELNDARRHLKPAERKAIAEQQEERRKRIEQMVKDRAKGATLEALATKYGISYSQVRRDLGEAVCPPGQTEGERVVGKDGKSYPARKPRKAPEPVPEPIGEDDDHQGDEDVEDLGHGESRDTPRLVATHPDPAVAAVRAVAISSRPPAPVRKAQSLEELQGMAKLVDSGLQLVEKLREVMQQMADDPLMGERLRSQLRAGGKRIRPRELARIAELIRTFMPAALGCHKCDGKDDHCAYCHGRNYLTASAMKNVPKDATGIQMIPRGEKDGAA